MKIKKCIHDFIATHEENDVLKDQGMWTVTIGDSFVSHRFRFKASSAMSINIVYAILIMGLRLTGFKK